MKAGKQMFRNHPAFDPPEPTVQQRSTASEIVEVKRHFTFADQYLLDGGPYKDNALREREIPEHGWVWGIYREFALRKKARVATSHATGGIQKLLTSFAYTIITKILCMQGRAIL